MRNLINVCILENEIFVFQELAAELPSNITQFDLRKHAPFVGMVLLLQRKDTYSSFYSSDHHP